MRRYEVLLVAAGAAVGAGIAAMYFRQRFSSRSVVVNASKPAETTRRADNRALNLQLKSSGCDTTPLSLTTEQKGDADEDDEGNVHKVVRGVKRVQERGTSRSRANTHFPTSVKRGEREDSQVDGVVASSSDTRGH